MMSIFLIKTALLRFGIVVQSVSFDVDNEKINVKYMLKGVEQNKSIQFSQIEELFTSDSDGPAAYEPPYYAPNGPDTP